jgi:hypothetical protein
LPQRQQFIGGGSKPFGHFLDCRLGCSELFEHGAQRRDRNALLLSGARKYFFKNLSNTFFVHTDGDLAVGNVTPSSDAAANRRDARLRRRPSGAPATQPTEHGSS